MFTVKCYSQGNLLAINFSHYLDTQVLKLLRIIGIHLFLTTINITAINITSIPHSPRLGDHYRRWDRKKIRAGTWRGMLTTVFFSSMAWSKQ